MCKEIKFKKFVNKQFDQLENPEISEIKLMLAEDENFRASRAKQKMNRANRRKSGTAKKYRLGRQWQYADEQIDAYWVEKDGDKKITHWVADPQELKNLTIEEYWKYWNDIPWHKVKGINPKNCGYSEGRRWGKSLELAKQRMSGKNECVNYDPDETLPITNWVSNADALAGVYFEMECFDNSSRVEKSDDGRVLHDNYDPITVLDLDLIGIFWADLAIKSRIKEINRQKQALLEEYADKIEELNKELRKLMD